MKLKKAIRKIAMIGTGVALLGVIITGVLK